MPSFKTWSDEVFLSTRCGEQCLPVSLGQPTVTDVSREKAGYMERSMLLSPTRCRQPTLRHLSCCKLAGEIDESTSDVVVYGMVQWRPPAANCGEQWSLASLGQPMVTDVSQEKAGYMERSMLLSPTRCRRTTLGLFSDGKLAGEIDESTRWMSSFTASSDGVLSGVSPGERCPHGMVDALDFNQGIDGRCDAAMARSTRRRLTSRCQMSSFTAWSDEVFLRHGVERNALLSLCQAMVTMCHQVKAGPWIGRCA